jgi:serine/threonine protein kinase
VLERPGDVIGRYKLFQRIGEGGFGVVYLAEQIEPMQRKVALKIIKAGMDTQEIIARFEAEGQALALMDHPNIAKVLDGGATATGRPYFVMELVQGVPITKYCDQNHLSTDQRLKLFEQVCQAVQHAHQKGVIHRDLKPANILVQAAEPGQQPVPKVIDFGVAKALGQRLTSKTLFTGYAQMVGTPAYMSPEQAQLSGVDADTRSDIYSLGALLYELLTGHTPFDRKRLLEAGVDEIRRIIREEEPARPSTRLTTLAAGEQDALAKRRQAEPPELIRLVRGDLDWIVMKCLEKDRSRRYETADGLAQDIRRHLANEPVVAGPPTRLYRARKFIRRNRTAVLATAVVLCALVLGTSGALLGLAKASRERNRAEAILHQVDLKHAQELLETDRAAEGLANLALLVREKPSDLAVAEWLLNEMTQRSFPLPLCAPIQHDDHVLSARFSPAGRRILTVSRNNTARVWDAATGQPLTPPLEHNPSLVRKNEFLGGLHTPCSPASALTARAWPRAPPTTWGASGTRTRAEWSLRPCPTRIGFPMSASARTASWSQRRARMGG